MKKRRDLAYFIDILEAINKIETYTIGIDYDQFLQQPMVIDAVIRNLEIIGEASKHLSQESRSKYPNIPWKKIISLRNILIHEYFGVDESIIWEIIRRNLPELKPTIESAVRDLETDIQHL